MAVLGGDGRALPVADQLLADAAARCSPAGCRASSSTGRARARCSAPTGRSSSPTSTPTRSPTRSSGCSTTSASGSAGRELGLEFVRGHTLGRRRRAGRARAAQRAPGARWLSAVRPPALGALMAVEPAARRHVGGRRCRPSRRPTSSRTSATCRRSPSATRCRATRAGRSSRPQLSQGIARRQLRPGRRAAAGQARVERPASSASGRRRRRRRRDDDGGGPGPATDYPPTAYAWQALGYVAASGGTLFDELLGARLMSRAVDAGHGARRRGCSPARCSAAGGCCRPPPPRCRRWRRWSSFVSSSVSPDGMLYAVWTLALWLGVRCIKRGVPLRDGVAFFALVGLACTVKPTSYALLARGALVAVLGLCRAGGRGGRGDAAAAAVVAVPLALTLGAWVLVAALGSTGRPTRCSSHGGRRRRAPTGASWRRTSGSTTCRARRSSTESGSRRRLSAAAGLDHPGRGRAFGWLEIKFDAVGLPRARRCSRWPSSARRCWRSCGRGGASTGAWSASWRSPSWRCSSACTGPTTTSSRPARRRSCRAATCSRSSASSGSRWPAPSRSCPRALRGAATGAAVAGLLVFHLLALGLVLERFYA